ncbi:MAG: hypothetical protein HC780_16240 [Leptolyngbyaceae cyanobacterium CSU_1_3]|nr:hypothetical protein [Leptolyngbyaceae cyanobacterium CSU_1_3]
MSVRDFLRPNIDLSTEEQIERIVGILPVENFYQAVEKLWKRLSISVESLGKIASNVKFCKYFQEALQQIRKRAIWQIF